MIGTGSRDSPCHLALGLKDLLMVNNDGATRCSNAEANRPAFHTLTSVWQGAVTTVSIHSCCCLCS